MDLRIIAIAAVSILSVIVAVALMYLAGKKYSFSKNKNKQIDTDIHCKFTEREVKLVESIMNKYRCTFDELILLGTWKFQDEGRNVFDLVDDRRLFVNLEETENNVRNVVNNARNANNNQPVKQLNVEGGTT